jgi:hypothetical protein
MKAPKLSGKYELVARIDINASQKKSWEVLEDFNNVYTWAPGVTESHGIGKGAKQIGAGRHCKLDGFGEIDEIITHWQEGTGFVYDVSPLGPLHNAFSSWWLTPKDATSTRLEVVFSYNIRFGLFGKIMHKLIMRGKLEKSLPETLQSVKKRIETGESIRPMLTVAAAV